MGVVGHLVECSYLLLYLSTNLATYSSSKVSILSVRVPRKCTLSTKASAVFVGSSGTCSSPTS